MTLGLQDPIPSDPHQPWDLPWGSDWGRTVLETHWGLREAGSGPLWVVDALS